MSKDFIDSWEQKSWEFAANEYARMQHWLSTVNNERMRDYAKERIAALEKKYPAILK